MTLTCTLSFIYKFIYLFYKALVTLTVRTPTVGTGTFRPTDRPNEPDRTRIQSDPKFRPEPNPESEPDVPNCFKKKHFQVVHPHNASKHFSHEHLFKQSNLDHLVLHTLRYEVMCFGSGYIIQDPDVSYLYGISHSFVFLFYSNSILT